MHKLPQRQFFLGSQWLYYKFYTGYKTSEVLLTELIKPVAEDLEDKGYIDQWFFIRYADPHFHLRVRFKVTDTSKLGYVVELLHNELKPWCDSDFIWKIQTDTYNRELERYGMSAIELSESIFHNQSNVIVKFLDLIEGDEGEEIRWRFGLLATDALLDLFEYGLDEKLVLMDRLKTGFGMEFNMSRPLKKQLDKKFRYYRSSIEEFMNLEKLANEEYTPILKVLQEMENAKKAANKILRLNVSGTLEPDLDGFMGSHIHMLMNRLFKSKNRLNEMVCYDFLYRYYKSKSARIKTNATVIAEQA